jgi:hypothetical protein
LIPGFPQELLTRNFLIGKMIDDDMARPLFPEAYHHQAVGARFGSPDFTLPAEELADPSSTRRKREGAKRLPFRVEPDEGISPEVTHPDLVDLVHIYSVGLG